jgi:ribosomal protein S18 acetylase RimI-like enzyme
LTPVNARSATVACVADAVRNSFIFTVFRAAFGAGRTTGHDGPMLIRSFDPADTEAVVQLWTDCGLVRPWNDPRRDIERKLTEQPELFLVGAVDGTVVATAMVGFDGHRGWVYYLAVTPSSQGAGYGRTLMAHAEALLLERGCPKINLQIRAGNERVMEFYRSLGYTPDDAVAMGKRLIPDV